jgi:hypothetical protein
MRKAIPHAAMLFTVGLLITGCYSDREYSETAVLNSIPSGATVCNASGEAVGKTPLGIAVRCHLEWSPFKAERCTTLSTGGLASPQYAGQTDTYDIVLNGFLIKQGYERRSLNGLHLWRISVGQGPASGRVVAVPLTPISEAQQPGVSQQQQQQTVVITGGKEEETSKAFGTLLVTTSPGSAEVFVDGAFVGNAPCKLKLEVGLHTLVVSVEGYGDYERAVRVLPDSESTVQAELKRQNQ